MSQGGLLWQPQVSTAVAFSVEAVDILAQVKKSVKNTKVLNGIINVSLLLIWYNL
jgi:hypothetical protein